MSQSQIPLLIVNNAKKLIEQLIPSITQIADKTGIKNIGQPNMEMPGVCLPQNELQEIITLRNNIVDKLNSISSTIDILRKPIDTLTPILNTAENGLNIGKGVLIGIETALTIAPPGIPIPGSAITGYMKANNLINEILPPIINNTSNRINSITTALDYASNIIFKINNLLKTIDLYLRQCSSNISPTNPLLTPVNDYINQIDQQYTNILNQQENPNSQIYQGFILDIVEEPFSPTVKRIKAVAKNSQGIILLQTPLSFTTTPQVLIEELKLIIDKSNLKAN